MYILAEVEEGGGAAASVKRRRRSGSGVSVRRRRPRWQVQADAAAASAAQARTPLQRLLAACRRAFGGPGIVPAPADVSLVRGILDNIRPGDVHLSAEHRFFKGTDAPGPHRRPTITRTTMYRCPNFSIEIFFLPAAAVIPFHDHPGMTVLSKLLLGSLHVRSYDWADPPVVAVGSTPDHRPARLAKLVLDADLAAPCDALVLHPESGGNVHRFAAAAPCAVLDVLGPPYSGDRDCTYYQDLPYGCSDPVVEDGQQKAAARLGWLVETEKPKELEMYEVPYRGPPIL